MKVNLAYSLVIHSVILLFCEGKPDILLDYSFSHTLIIVICNIFNRIGCVMVSVLTSSAVDCGFEPRSVQTMKTMQLVFVASPLSTCKP